MGEEAKEEAKVEEKEAEKKESEEKKAEEEKKEEEKAVAEENREGEEEAAKPPTPPPPVVLFVDLHCTGCAKKVKRSILKCKGVEGVEMEMAKNEVTVKGIVDPQALCARVEKKTMRKARVISPLPPEGAEADAPKEPQVVHSQVSEVSTVQVLVNMHCEACAQQLQKKILKMRGVQTVETSLSEGKLTVTGTMTGDKIVEYIHRRTGKLATVVPPPPPPEPPKEEGDKKDDEKPSEDKKDEKPDGEGKTEDSEKKDEDGDRGDKEEKKQEAAAMVVADGFPPEEMMKRMVYWPWHGGYGGSYSYKYGHHPEELEVAKAMPMMHPYHHEEEMMRRRMMMMQQWMSPPPPASPMYYYVDRQPPAPQFFSDENPNACVIS